jgi:hypothetical protein
MLCLAAELYQFSFIPVHSEWSPNQNDNEVTEGNFISEFGGQHPSRSREIALWVGGEKEIDGKIKKTLQVGDIFNGLKMYKSWNCRLK